MLSLPLRTSLGRLSSSRRQATTMMSRCCKQCRLRFDGCLQLSVCIWWWRDDRRERTLWRLHWQLQPLMKSQFRDVTGVTSSSWSSMSLPPEAYSWVQRLLDCQLICRLQQHGADRWNAVCTVTKAYIWRSVPRTEYDSCTAAVAPTPDKYIVTDCVVGTVAFSNCDTENYGIE